MQVQEGSFQPLAEIEEPLFEPSSSDEDDDDIAQRVSGVEGTFSEAVLLPKRYVVETPR